MSTAYTYDLTEIAKAVLPMVSGLGGVWLGHFLSTQNQTKLNRYRDRIELYGLILGVKLRIKQVMVSRYESYVYSDYHERKWQNSGHPSSSIDLDEAVRWMRKSEDLALDLMIHLERLFQYLGRAKAVYKDNVIDEAAGRLFQFKALTLAKPLTGDSSTLDQWKVNAVTQIQKAVDEIFDSPFSDLAGAMERILKDD